MPATRQRPAEELGEPSTRSSIGVGGPSVADRCLGITVVVLRRTRRAATAPARSAPPSEEATSGQSGAEGRPSGEPILPPMTPGDRARPCSSKSTVGRSRSPTGARSLLEVLREDLGSRSAKDGCSPQGQCGCCTVLVDGQPRVACVTPARRVAGRSITTVDGLDPSRSGTAGPTPSARPARASAGSARPGIVCRLEGAAGQGRRARTDGHAAVEQALLAHLCRCTGWRTILDAWDVATGDRRCPVAGTRRPRRRRASGPRSKGARHSRWRPTSRSATAGSPTTPPRPTRWSPCPTAHGGWAVGETLAEARAAAGKVQGRRTTVDARPAARRSHPATGPPRCARRGSSRATSSPTPSWCEPGGEPAVAARQRRRVRRQAGQPASAPRPRELADGTAARCGCCSAARTSCASGPKRPPVAGGADADGTGVLRVVRTPGIADGHRAPSPRGSSSRRSTSPARRRQRRPAGGGLGRGRSCSSPAPGARLVPVDRPARRAPSPRRPIDADGSVRVRVTAGESLDEVVLRSYAPAPPTWRCRGCRREGIAVDGDGTVHDLTIRSFGILRAVDTPPIEVEVVPARRPAGARLRRRVRRRRRRRLAPRRARPPTGRPAPAGAEPHWWQTAGMSKPLGPYTPIVRAGDWLIVSGQLGLLDGELVNGGSTRQSSARPSPTSSALLESEGAALGDVVKTTVFLRHLGTDYDADERGLRRRFGDHRPARSAIGVAELPTGGSGRGRGVGPPRGRMTACPAPLILALADPRGSSCRVLRCPCRGCRRRPARSCGPPPR